MNDREKADALRLDAGRVRASFDRASGDYDRAAALQTRVRDALIERVRLFELTPEVVLDLGAGTGLGARALRGAYRRALVMALDSAPGMLREARRRSGIFKRFERILADAACLPLATGIVDLVFSSLMLQWCDDLAAPLAEVRRVLKPGGLFAFSTFGPDTLQELRASWAAADEHSHVNRFVDMQTVGDALRRAGFAEPVLDFERIELTYPDTLALMRDLKAIGAHNATRGRPRGLTGRRSMEKMRASYESFRHAAYLPATFEVIYATASWREDKRADPVIAGEACITVDATQRCL
jgi:malonyl-CoA O-methyltransferase